MRTPGEAGPHGEEAGFDKRVKHRTFTKKTAVHVQCGTKSQLFHHFGQAISVCMLINPLPPQSP